MPSSGLQHTLDRLRRALAPDDLADEQLLQRFIVERDELSFANLVRRHGGMVLGLAKRILGNAHDSEDVFQATFLVLAQKARSVVHREALASWLYKVSYRIALKARARNERRRRKEKQVEVMPDPHTPTPASADWEHLLDEELSRLPEKYRLPVILCDLEGRPRQEVERRLRLPAGTLSSRLTTARRMLAKRLSRRGLSFSAGALAALFSQTASAALPPGLAGATARKAILVAAGHLTAVSSSVLVLMKTGAKAMLLTKLKATLITTVFLAFVGGGLVYSGGGQPPPKSDLDALRRENELLKVNLRVTLEKIETLEKRLAAMPHSGLDFSNTRPTTTNQDAAKTVDDLARTKAFLDAMLGQTQATQNKAVLDAFMTQTQASKNDSQAMRSYADAVSHLVDRATTAQKKTAEAAAAHADAALRAHRHDQAAQSSRAELDRALNVLRNARTDPNAVHQAADILERALQRMREQEQGPKK